MKLVIVESPYAGDVEANEEYARACLADCLERGEAPFASHLIYTQPGVLDDTIPEERDKGMSAGYAWMNKAELVAVYLDKGVSHGMEVGIKIAKCLAKPIEYRSIISYQTGLVDVL